MESMGIVVFVHVLFPTLIVCMFVINIKVSFRMLKSPSFASWKIVKMESSGPSAVIHWTTD